MKNNLTDTIYKLFEHSKKSREDLTKKWDKWFSAYKGADEGSILKPKWKKDIALNYCFSSIETIIPTMTDNKPRLFCLPEERGDEMASKLANNILDYKWDDLDLDVSLTRVLRAMLIWGNAFWKIIWDYALDDVNVIMVNPHEIFVDPEATTLADCRYIIHAVIRDLAYIHKTYPENGKDVKADTSHSDVEETRGLAATGDWKEDFDKKVLLLECWLRDPDEMEEYVEQTENGEVKAERPKYPNGRLITVANHILLRDKKNPYDDFPFVKFTDYDLPNSFWGMGEIEQIYLLQQEINKRKAQIMKNSDLVANPSLLVPRNSGIDTEKLTNEPGGIIPYVETPPSFLVPGILPAYVFNLLERSKYELDSITGVHDVTQGRQPSGITAGIAIAELQEAAQTRLRLKTRMMEKTLRTAGYKILRLIHDFYTEPRILQIVGEDGKPQIIEFRGKDIPKDFKIQVEAGSSLPVNRYAKFQQAILLYNVKAIDQMALLEAANWPDRESIVARMQAPPMMLPGMGGGMPPMGGGAPPMPGGGAIPGAPAMPTIPGM